MNYFSLISKRQSCRGYSDRTVEKELLVRCVEAAALAPSASNKQPWRYVIVHRPAVLPQLAKFLQEEGYNKFADKCQAFILVFEEPVPVTVTVTGRKSGQQFAQMDIGMSVMQLCLAATELGLSTCIMGSFNEQGITEFLGIETDSPLKLVIGIGYAAEDTIREKRRKDDAELYCYLGE